MTDRITKFDIVAVLANLNRKARESDPGSLYSAERGPEGWTIRRDSEIEVSELNTRDAYFMLNGILRGRRHEREDRPDSALCTRVVHTSNA